MSAAPLLLVVDDNEDVREMLTMVLETVGFRVAAAADGREALDMIAEQPPHLMLLDMRMPVMDGWELCRILDERGDRPRTIVVTAAADPAARAAEVHADAYLGKPFDIVELERLVRRVLDAG